MANLTGLTGHRYEITEVKPLVVSLPEKYPRVIFTSEGGTGRLYRELIELIKLLHQARPKWNFRVDSYEKTTIFQDSENIGTLAMRYHRSSFQLGVSSPNISKTRGDLHVKHLRSVPSAEKTALTFCKPMKDEDVCDNLGHFGSFNQDCVAANQQMIQVVKNIVVRNTSIMIDYCVSGNAEDPALKQVIEEVRKHKEECDFIQNKQRNAAVASFLWKRKSGWYVYRQNNGKFSTKEYYATIEELPQELRGKLTTLMMLSKDTIDHFERGVGKKISNSRFWIMYD